MGIYGSGKIFGIRLYTMDYDTDYCHRLLERTYLEPMTLDQKREVYVYYQSLSLEDKANVMFSIYHSLERGSAPCMHWTPCSLELFQKEFMKCNKID